MKLVADALPAILAGTQGVDVVAEAVGTNGALAIAVALFAWVIVIAFRDIIIPLMFRKKRNGNGDGRKKDWDALVEAVDEVQAIVSDDHFQHVGDRIHAIYRTIQAESTQPGTEGRKLVWGTPQHLIEEHTKALQAHSAALTANTDLSGMMLTELRAGRGIMAEMKVEIHNLQDGIALLIERDQAG